MYIMTSEETRVYADLQNNSFIFFKDFIERITTKDIGSEDNISNELVILSVTSLQIAMELALKALVLKKRGFKSIIQNNDINKTDSQLFFDFQNNLLKTKKFEEIKKYVFSEKLIRDFTDDDIETITLFQKYRNGIAHFSFKFKDGDYFDLKYDITYFVVSILIKVLCSGDDDIKPSEFLAYSLGGDFHEKLINYQPYVGAMQKMAGDHSDKAFYCINCNNSSTYSVDEKYCYCCNFNGEGHGFRKCEHCGEEESMIFDGLNLELNDNETKGFCLNCLSDYLLFVCPKCENSYNLETNDHSEICNINQCKVYE